MCWKSRSRYTSDLLFKIRFEQEHSRWRENYHTVCSAAAEDYNVPLSKHSLTCRLLRNTSTRLIINENSMTGGKHSLNFGYKTEHPDQKRESLSGHSHT